MDAIIYAAGRATRLGPAYATHAKIMLEVGGRTLLEWHIAHLANAGISRVFIVTGHRREDIQALLPELRDRYRMPVEELFNAEYCEGSVISVGVSLPTIEAATDPILLMDGDVFYDHSILQRLLGSRHRTALLIDTGYSTLDDDPVLVPVRKGKPFEFLKRWKGKADLVGESIGFFKLHTADIPLLAAETRGRLAGTRRLESYDEIIRALVRAGWFDYEDVTGVPWTEIDFPRDVEYARNVVFPACARTEQIVGSRAGP
jgi:choline kinase